MPADRLLVVERDGRVPGLRTGPRTAYFYERPPRGLVRGETSAVLRGFVVDLADRLALNVCALNSTPDWSMRAWPSMVSPAKPTHFWSDAPERCWTTTYAWWGAPALTHELVGLVWPIDGEPPHAEMKRASVALAHMRCLRTIVPPGGQPFPNAPQKADRQELPCRCARTGCR
jgi:hypothetical protein